MASKESNGNHHTTGKVQPKAVPFTEWVRGSNQLKFVTRGELVGVMRVVMERRLEVERNIVRLEGWRHRLGRWFTRKDIRPAYEQAIMAAYYGLFSNLEHDRAPESEEGRTEAGVAGESRLYGPRGERL